jgi:rhodanese-related sulfurtransferase
MPMTERDRERELQVQFFRAKLAAEKQKVDVARKVKEGKGDFVLVDTRDKASFEKEHIPGAIHVPLDQVAALAPSLAQEKEYVTYCWHST